MLTPCSFNRNKTKEESIFTLVNSLESIFCSFFSNQRLSLEESFFPAKGKKGKIGDVIEIGEEEIYQQLSGESSSGCRATVVYKPRNQEVVGSNPDMHWTFFFSF